MTEGGDRVADDLAFRVLGPVVAERDGRELALPGPLQRALLAALLIEAGTVIPVDRLIDRVWDGAPPDSAVASLRNHVLRLRAVLGDVGGVRLRTAGSGYVIDVRPGELDIEVFEGLCRSGRAAHAARDWHTARADLGAALELWRGEPFADLSDGWRLGAIAARWGQQRLLALQWRIDADLHLGLHQDVMTELWALVRAHPLVEPFHGQLMTALHLSGRQAEALEVFRRIRRLLREELGVEPGEELSKLHQRILAGDGAVLERGDADSASRADAGPIVERVVPEQLPADVADFTGRAEQVKLTAELLRVASGPVVVAGVGGVGKTTIAVHVAHRVRDYFPDGQLFIRLRGASFSPLSPAEVLGRVLRDLGVAPDRVPVDEEERAALYRSRLAGLRLLLVLDDARDAAQVRALIPGSRDCAVLVTSRSRLADLEGSSRVDLATLVDDEARDLFVRVVGSERGAAEPEAVRDVLAACAGLPLAVRIAGARLAARPGWAVRAFAERLADTASRLDQLAVGDLAVRTSLTVSFEQLSRSSPGGSGGAAEAVRLLGLWTGPDIAVPAAAALFGVGTAEAEDALEELVDAHLLQAASAGRYSFHDLVRAFAAELAAEAASGEREAALRRIVGWYTHASVAAAECLQGRQIHPAPSWAEPPEQPLSVADVSEAMAWGDAERRNLVAVVQLAVAAGLPDAAWRVPVNVLPYYSRSRQSADWLAALEPLDAALDQLDSEARANVNKGLAAANAAAGRFAAAAEYGERAARFFRDIGDRFGEGAALNNRGIAMAQAGHRAPAIATFQQAAAVFREIGEMQGLAIQRINIGAALTDGGEYDEAATRFEAAIALAREHGFGYQLGKALSNLADVEYRRGRFDAARGLAEEALDVTRETGNRLDEAMALDTLGKVLDRAGESARALEAWRGALAILVEAGDHRGDEVADRLAERIGSGPEAK